MASPYDAISRAMSTPTLKGFIELTVRKERLLIAVSTILSVSDRAPAGCTITLAADLIHNSETLDTTLNLSDTYEQVISLLIKAQ